MRYRRLSYHQVDSWLVTAEKILAGLAAPLGRYSIITIATGNYHNYRNTGSVCRGWDVLLSVVIVRSGALVAEVETVLLSF